MDRISRKLSAVILVGVLAVLGLVVLPVAHTRQASTDVDIPKLVAKKNFVHQMTALSETTVFTPSADGVFRVSAYLTTGPQPFSSAFDQCGLSWTDEFRTHDSLSGGATFNVSAGPDNPAAEGAGSLSILIHAKAGKPISVLVTDGGSGSVAAPYDLYVTVEAL